MDRIERIASEVLAKDDIIIINTSVKTDKKIISNWNKLSDIAKKVFDECNQMTYTQSGALDLYNGSQLVASCTARIDEEKDNNIIKVEIEDMWVKVRGIKSSINVF